MKVVYLFLCILCTNYLNVSAQQNINDVQEVNYYGIDFSKVNIFQAKETREQFKSAFKAINDLTVLEDKKYDFEKFFRKTIHISPFTVADERNEESTPKILFPRTSSKLVADLKLTPEDVREVIAEYGNEDSGIGVVVIAVLLNKKTSAATYDVVFFDVKTKDILFEKQVIGMARGFGLRNFWANSLYYALRNWKYKVK